MKSKKKLLLFLLVLIILCLSMGYAIYWILKSNSTKTKIELSSFSMLSIKTEPKELSYETKKKDGSGYFISEAHRPNKEVNWAEMFKNSNLLARMNGNAQFMEFRSTQRYNNSYIHKYSISMKGIELIIFDVTNYKAEIIFSKEKGFSLKRDSKKHFPCDGKPVPSTKYLMWNYPVAFESKLNPLSDIAIKVPKTEKDNDHSPKSYILLPENASFFYSWNINSSLLFQKANFDNVQDTLGLNVQNNFLKERKEGDTDRIVKLSLTLRKDEPKPFLILTDNLDIYSKNSLISSPNSKYLIYGKFPSKQERIPSEKVEIRVSFYGGGLYYSFFASHPEHFNFRVDPFNYKVAVRNPMGKFFIREKKYNFEEYAASFKVKFVKFPVIGTDNYFHLSKPSNNKNKKIIITGQADSFLHLGKNYIKNNWSEIPPEIKGASIAFFFSILFWVLTKLWESRDPNKIIKVEIINSNYPDEK